MSHDARTHTHAVTVTDASFAFEVLRADLPVLIDFYADWCGSCQRLDPVLAELAGDYDGRITVAKIDVDRHPATAQRYAVRGIPTLILFHQGEERWRLVDVVRKATIAETLDACLASIPEP
jgi:thioredoxin 1